MIALQVNGRKELCEEGTTLAGLLERLRLDPRRVAVERNGSIVPKSAFAETTLVEGDLIEIVEFVGGG
jgi:thiamine biosynthesis protein ThiS